MNRMGILMSRLPDSRRAPARAWRRQRGVTLIELMISIAIGLFVVAVALAALMVSRGVSGTVSDVSQLQQQAAYAMRIIGQQVRLAGSTQLNLDTSVSKWNDPANPAEFQAEDSVAFMTTGYTAMANVISGADDTLTVGYVNYWEPNVANDSNNTLFRGCLGSGGGVTNTLITNTFRRDAGANELLCKDGAGNEKSLIRNVADFQVKYLVQSNQTAGSPTIYRTNAAGVGDNWRNVYAVEVCIELVGDERIGLPDKTTYTNCSGGSAAITDGRLHMVFKDTFELRSQGLF